MNWRQKLYRPIAILGKASADHLTAWSTVVLALATLLLAVIAIVTLQRTEAITKQGERAWISPITILPSLPLKENEVIHFSLVLSNTGKQPALGVTFAQQNGVVKAPPIDDWTNLTVEKNTSCEGLEPIPGSYVIYPTALTAASTHGSDSGTGKDPAVATPAIINGLFHYYVRGCIAYLTFGEPHTSKYCYVLQTRATVQPGSGQPAPVTVAPAFLSCPSGFDAD